MAIFKSIANGVKDFGKKLKSGFKEPGISEQEQQFESFWKNKKIEENPSGKKIDKNQETPIVQEERLKAFWNNQELPGEQEEQISSFYKNKDLPDTPIVRTVNDSIGESNPAAFQNTNNQYSFEPSISKEGSKTGGRKSKGKKNRKRKNNRKNEENTDAENEGPSINESVEKSADEGRGTQNAKQNSNNQNYFDQDTTTTSTSGTGKSADGSSGGTTKATKSTKSSNFVPADDPRVGTTDENGNLYMPDDIAGGSIETSAKQHAYQKAYKNASNVEKWQKSERNKILGDTPLDQVTSEQQKQLDAIDKKAGQIVKNWRDMKNNSTKINPGVSDYVLGNPHTTAGVLGSGTLGYLALQLSDSRGQMTNQQLYGQDDLT